MSDSTESKSLTKGIIYVILTALCFSVQEISGSMLTSDLNAFQVNATSYLIGAFILLPLGIREIRRRKINLLGKDYLYFILLGFFQVAIGMTLLQEALYYTRPAIVAVLVCSNAIMTVPLARIINKEKFDPKAWISIFIAAAGIVVIFDPFAASAGPAIGVSRNVIGILFGLAGAVCLAMFNVLATKKIKQYGKEVTNSLSFFFGVAIMYIYMAIVGIPIFKHLTPIVEQAVTLAKVHGIDGNTLHTIMSYVGAYNQDVGRNWLILLFIGIVVKGVGFFFFVGAMKEIGAINTTSVFYIKPILVPILAFFILGDVVHVTTVIGIACIVVAAVSLYFIRKSAAAKAARISLK